MTARSWHGRVEWRRRALIGFDERPTAARDRAGADPNGGRYRGSAGIVNSNAAPSPSTQGETARIVPP